MMFTLRILPFLLALFAPLACLAQSTADLATMKDRVREDDRASVGASAALVAEWKNSLQANGSWADINYADKSRTAWNPLNHLVRLVGMAVAYQTPGTAEFASAAVRQGISNGVNYWYASNPTSDNWWFNDIGAPRQLGYLLLQMQNELTATQISTGASKMAAGPARTGQNQVWISSIAIYRGLLENNISRVSSGMDGVKETVVVTTAEGIQPDYSFHQHGAQLYSGGYGHGLLNDVVRWVFMGASTGFQFPADKVEIMADYILEGSGWMLRHELMDYSTIGREISRRGTSLKGLGLLKTF